MIRARLAAGELPPGAKTLADAQRMIFNDRLDATVALVFMAVAVLVIVVSIREWLLVLSHRKPAVLREAPFVPSALGLTGRLRAIRVWSYADMSLGCSGVRLEWTLKRVERWACP